MSTYSINDMRIILHHGIDSPLIFLCLCLLGTLEIVPAENNIFLNENISRL